MRNANSCVPFLVLIFGSCLLYRLISMPTGVTALSAFQYGAIVGANVCALDCDGHYHTLCDKLVEPICNEYERINIFKVDAIKLVNLKEMLVHGHNGIRNRIAERMKVSNMVQLDWDDQLADMCVNYLKQCQPFEDDDCTRFKRRFAYREEVGYFDRVRGGYKWLSQNRFTVHSKFFPKNFIQMALRTWYFEKNLLAEPIDKYDHELQIYVGKIVGENNFTHLAFPQSFRFGCAIAQIDNYFTLICNYFPYYRSSGKEHMYFMRGEPASNCPIYFPLKDHEFFGLCSDDKPMSYTKSMALPLFRGRFTLCGQCFIGCILSRIAVL